MDGNGVTTARSHPMQLPTTEEIKQMMAVEAKRKPANSKHFPDFSVVNEWISVLGLKTDLFLRLNTIEDVNNEAGLIKPLVVKETLVKRPVSMLKKVENYLGEEDKLEKSDVAIVFGGKTLARADKGAQMYLKGWTRRLLMTGNGPVYKGVFNESEA